jgi:hypothetical protein
MELWKSYNAISIFFRLSFDIDYSGKEYFKHLFITIQILLMMKWLYYLFVKLRNCMYNITLLNLVKQGHTMTNFHRILAQKFNTTTSFYTIKHRQQYRCGEIIWCLHCCTFCRIQLILSCCVVRTHDHEIESKPTQAVHSLYKQTSAYSYPHCHHHNLPCTFLMPCDVIFLPRALWISYHHVHNTDICFLLNTKSTNYRQKHCIMNEILHYNW